jgi:hypothetical protein
MSCSGGRDAPTLIKKYWASPSKPYETMICKSAQECPGGHVGDNVCGIGRTGLLCSECPTEYFLKYGSGECVKCNSASIIPFMLFLIIFIISPTVIHFVNRLSNGKAMVSDAMLLSVVLGQLISYSQIFAVLGTLNVPWPTPIAWSLDALRILGFQFQLLMPACVFGGWSFEAEFLFGVLLPVAFVGVYAVHFLMFLILPKAGVKVEPFQVDMVISTCGRVFVILHVAILKQATEIFECYEHPNGQSSIVEFPGTLCWESSHNAMIPIAVVMILFYSVILFGHLCWVLWVAPLRFAEKPFFNRYRFQ